MGYKNPYAVGFEVERQLSGDYNVNSHGDLGAFYNSVTNADLPSYTTLFYFPSEHDQFSEFKYDKIMVAYDKGLQQIKEGVRGPPMEAYIPPTMMMPDGAGKMTTQAEVLPKPSIVDEILKAQAELLGKADDKMKEDFLKNVKAVKLTEMSQEIRLKRTLRKIEIIRD